MNLFTHLKTVATGLLRCSLFLLMFHTIHAQDKSAIDTVQFILKSRKSVELIANDLNTLGTYYLNTNELENAELVINEFKKFSKQNTYQKGIDDAYNLEGSLARSHNDNAKARRLSNEWKKEAARSNNDYGMNGASYLLVKILYSEGKMDSVISVAQEVLNAPQATYDSVYFPKFNAMLGNVYYRLGDFRNANEYYLKALVIAEKTGNEQLQSACIGNLGIINKELRNYREAIKFYKKALALRIKNNQLHDVAGTYVGIASCYQNMQLNDSAVILYTKALDLFKKLESKNNIALVNNNLGQLLVGMNQPDSGMQYLLQAKQQFKELNDSINIANNAWAVGDAWWDIYKLKKDKAYLQKAFQEMHTSEKLAQALDMISLKMMCYSSLTAIYEEMENESQAFKYLKLYHVINDSILSQQYTGQIAEMQTKYDTEKKEIEISKLGAAKLLDAEKIARQKTMNYSLLTIAALILISGFVIFRNVQNKRVAEQQIAILEKQNAIESMRNKIASDVHDEMGANLTRLGLNAQQLLQSPVIPEKEKQLAERISLQSKEIITGMREIIWASNPANDNLKSMLGFMRQYIDRFFDGTYIRPVVNFPHDVGEVTLHPEVRRNLFFILKESLNNAIKYSGSDRIDIDFLNENESFNLHIKDYGKGIDDLNKDEFNNGLRNMKMRAELIHSFFKLITAPGQGVQISIEGKLY